MFDPRAPVLLIYSVPNDNNNKCNLNDSYDDDTNDAPNGLNNNNNHTKKNLMEHSRYEHTSTKRKTHLQQINEKPQVIDKSMPVFSKQFYSDIVPENIELHTPLSVAIQAESPLGRKLIYTIVKGNELEEFTVDFNTGMILRSIFHNIFYFLFLFFIWFIFSIHCPASLYHNIYICIYDIYVWKCLIFHFTWSSIEFEIYPFFCRKFHLVLPFSSLVFDLVFSHRFLNHIRVRKFLRKT